MSYKGAASALSVLIVVGIAIGVMLMNQMTSKPLSSSPPSALATPAPEMNSSPTILLPETGEDVLATIVTEQLRLKEWEDHLVQFQTELEKEKQRLGKWEKDILELQTALTTEQETLRIQSDQLQNREQVLNKASATVDADQHRLKKWEESLSYQQTSLEKKDAYLKARETDILTAQRSLKQEQEQLTKEKQQVQMLTTVGYATLFTSAVTVSAQLVVILYRRYWRRHQKAAAIVDGTTWRRAYLRPIQRVQRQTPCNQQQSIEDLFAEQVFADTALFQNVGFSSNMTTSFDTLSEK